MAGAAHRGGAEQRIGPHNGGRQAEEGAVSLTYQAVMSDTDVKGCIIDCVFNIMTDVFRFKTRKKINKDSNLMWINVKVYSC